MKPDLSTLLTTLLIFAAPAIASAATSPTSQPFLLGADISWTLEDEAAGATYFDHGVKGDLLDILAAHGFNAIRISVFVDPYSSRGYARGRSEPFGDLNHLLVMAKRASAHHMPLLLDIMYADSYADPEGQNKPVAWEKLPFDQVVKREADYTHDVIAALAAQGTSPKWVQIGNEITHGMLWPDGRIISQIPSGNPDTDAHMRASGLTGLGNYDNLATLLKAAIDQVHAVDPNIKIVLHNSLGRLWPRVEEWCDNLISRGVKFDIVGVSCYTEHEPGNWQTTFTGLAKKYPDKQFLVLEYSGQKEMINDLTFASHGLGTFIWEPTRHREAIFDHNGVNAGDLTNPATAPTSRPRNLNGSRYDANDFLYLYDKLSARYNPATR